jgi:hypothetical protein
METEMKKGELAFAFWMLAEWTGLEPATPGVTGRYSNQLNYHSLVLQKPNRLFNTLLVGAEGFEPPTFAL